jgi:hypothetical protein
MQVSDCLQRKLAADPLQFVDVFVALAFAWHFKFYNVFLHCIVIVGQIFHLLSNALPLFEQIAIELLSHGRKNTVGGVISLQFYVFRPIFVVIISLELV